MNDIVADLIVEENRRQEETLMMIPSENYASKAVMEAVGSCLMNKYAEGQVGKRYYQGNEVVDELEALCKERALEVFGVSGDEWGVNVQAHSGSEANLAVYRALLEPGEKILAMHLTDGGHLSHGWRMGERAISVSGIFWQSEFYHVDRQTGVFDYDELEKKIKKLKPKLLIAGGTAYPREIDHERMGGMARTVGAYYLADVAHEAGLIVAGVNKSPFEWADVVTMTTHKTLRGPRGAVIFSRKESRIMNHESRIIDNSLDKLVDFSVFPGMQGGPHMHTIGGIAVALGEALKPEFREYCQRVVENAKVLAQGLLDREFDVVSGGTDKHLVLVDLRSKNQSGWVVAWALETAGIIVNRITVPAETASPFYPSGIRLGTPGLSTRGMGSGEMKMIVEWIDRVVELVAEDQLPEGKQARKEWVKEYPEKVAKRRELVAIREQVGQLCGRFPIER